MLSLEQRLLTGVVYIVTCRTHLYVLYIEQFTYTGLLCSHLENSLIVCTWPHGLTLQLPAIEETKNVNFGCSKDCHLKMIGKHSVEAGRQICIAAGGAEVAFVIFICECKSGV